MQSLLVINAGSSSVKFSLLRPDLTLLFKGAFDMGKDSRFSASNPVGEKMIEKTYGALSYDACIETLLSWLEDEGEADFKAVGHRVVHGGQHFTSPIIIDDHNFAQLDALCPLAPLHQPHNLHAIRTLRGMMPEVPQVACFDTAFHATMSATTRRYAIPRTLEAEGIRRYGFHGLSYETIAAKLSAIAPAQAKGRIIVAHLGNGASLCALQDGKSVDTTMGFSALDGLVMGTRCGNLDPEIVLYLLREKKMNPQQVEDLLYRQSGLLGVSGISSDMRILQASSEGSAKEAIDLFVFRIVREIGALMATLGGLEGIVFTAGIGEHSPEIRGMVCKRLEWLGVKFNAEANQRTETLISTSESTIKVWVIPTDEEGTIARHTLALTA